MMLPLFAETAPSANNVMSVVVYLFMAASSLATVGLYLQGRRKQSTKREIYPQPLEVTGEIGKTPKRYNHDAISQRFTTVETRINGHDDKIRSLEEKLSEEIPQMERRLNAAGEGRASEIHKRINEILEAVSELRGEVRSKRS